jgi:hypothetical protein
MASVPVMISGVLWDHANKSGRAATMMGEATIVGLSVGGGPIMPEPGPPDSGPPSVPTHPIWGPPGISLPPGPGFPPVAGHPLPIPPVDTIPPPPEGEKPPPADGGWGYWGDPVNSWVFKPAPGQKTPKAP